MQSVAKANSLRASRWIVRTYFRELEEFSELGGSNELRDSSAARTCGQSHLAIGLRKVFRQEFKEFRSNSSFQPLLFGHLRPPSSRLHYSTPKSRPTSQLSPCPCVRQCRRIASSSQPASMRASPRIGRRWNAWSTMIPRARPSTSDVRHRGSIFVGGMGGGQGVDQPSRLC